MNESDRLGRFLESARKRALLEHSVRMGANILSSLVGLMLILALWANLTGPAGFWPYLAYFLILMALALGGTLGFFWPAYLWRTPSVMARLVGKKCPALSGDLLSAVELQSPAPLAPGSPNMVNAFCQEVADRAVPTNVQEIFPMRKAIHSVFLAGGILLGLFVAMVLFPKTVGRGLGFLFHTPTLFEGATVSRDPLVGDLRVTYDYPAYTRLPRQTIDGSTGDLHALRGTRVRLEMRPLHSVQRAYLLLGESGEEGKIETTLEQGRFVASFDLVEDQTYRVLLRPYLGRSLREDRFHRIDVESDRPPEVEVVAPSDRMTLSYPRPIELAYHARDDFGLGEVAIDYQINDGPSQRILLKDGQGSKEVRGTTTFEPVTTMLLPGAKVAYRIEARDRDDISGSKVGTSRTLYVLIQNPREDMEDRLELGREILEKLLACLADRLEMDGLGPEQSTELRKVRETEASALLLLGRLVEDVRRAGGANKTLAATLSANADRLAKWAKEEGEGGSRPAAAKSNGKRNAAVRHLAELESTILLLDDLMGRQRLDDLAAIGKELVSAHARLQELLERYKATGDESLRRQIERDVRELKNRLGLLMQKIAEVKARNEANTEWMNLPDAQRALAKASELDALLEKGDAQSLDRVLAELGDTLASMRDLMEKNADGFFAARFPQERRALAELQRKLGDLEGDERNLTNDSNKLAREIDGQIRRRLADKQSDTATRAKQKLETIAAKMTGTPPREISSAAEMATTSVRENIRQLRRLLPAKEWSEARRETERMVIGLSQLLHFLKRPLTANQPPSVPQSEYEDKVDEASQLARELATDLSRILPKSQDIMSMEQLESANAMGDRQDHIAGRATELSRDLAGRSDAIPQSEKTRAELDEITQQMRQARDDLRQGAAHEGAGRAEEIARRLAKLRQSLGERPSVGNRQNREPVHIPDAESSRAPRAWREELMEAMREKAADDFREEVRRYYEEIVK